MPLTKGLTSRNTCYGPPKQGHLEKRKKTKPTHVRALKFNPNHDKLGLFASAPDSGSGGGPRQLEFPRGHDKTPRLTSDSLVAINNAFRAERERAKRIARKRSPSQQAMQDELERQSHKPVHKVHTAEEAVALVLKGENVEIQDTKDVHTVLKKLGEMAIAAEAAGSKAQNFDPCTITVKGVSLFCSEKLKTKEFPHGIPRIEMPQFKSKKPIPGSEADKLKRDANGEVDASQAFLLHLKLSGVKTNPDGKMLARKLKASQAEMEGTKVAGMMLSLSRDPKTQKIWVSKDGYVIDGHHTWAAAVGRDAEDGNLDNDKEMDVVIVDMPMSKVYHLARKWTKKYGLPSAGVQKRDYVRVLQYACA